MVKAEPFANTQFTDGDGDSYIAGRCRCAQPGCELNRRAEQVVVVVGDWFARTNANAHLERYGGLLIAFVKPPLYVHREGDSRND